MTADEGAALRTHQLLLGVSAECNNCDARCLSRNALAWAHQHARRHPTHMVIVASEHSVRVAKETPNG